MSRCPHKREKQDYSSDSSSECYLPSLPPEPGRMAFQSSPHLPLAPRFTRPLITMPNFFGFRRARRSKAAPIHRCLLISEILSLILDCIRRFDESSENETKWDRTSGKRTLAALARSCRALSGPALDVLWMRLDNLDPLIKVLPRRMWSKKHYPFVVRLFLGEKQWATFRKYAVRVRYLRGPCWRVSATVQHNIIDALARYPQATLPLLPNLTELVWSELKMSNLIDPSVSLIRYFAGPGVTTVSLFLICWPNHVSSELAVLADLPRLCPNVTSFTAFFPRSSYNDHSNEIGEIVREWPNLRVLRGCALAQPVMDTITANRSLDTLSIELNNSSTALYVGRLPPHVHTWSLGGNSAALCLRYLTNIHGSPANFHLRIGADDSTTADMEELVGILPAQLDRDRLRSLTVELTSSYWSTPASDSFSLSPALLLSFASFPALKELDVSTYSAADMDDGGYASWMTGLRGLTSLKIGVSDVSKARPLASVGAVLAVLKACRNLETLWIVLDASLPIPSGAEDEDRQQVEGESEESSEIELETGDAIAKTREGGDEDTNEWGVTNHHITHLRVGYSPIGETDEALRALAKCLRTVMPRLERIRSDRYPPDVDERWARVQEMLVGRSKRKQEVSL